MLLDSFDVVMVMSMGVEEDHRWIALCCVGRWMEGDELSFDELDDKKVSDGFALMDSLVSRRRVGSRRVKAVDIMVTGVLGCEVGRRKREEAERCTECDR